MSLQPDSNIFNEWAAAVGAGAVGLLFSMQRFLRGWSANSRDIAKSDSERDVILLQSEQIKEYAKSLSETRAENSRLHAEVVTKQFEIDRLLRIIKSKEEK